MLNEHLIRNYSYEILALIISLAVCFVLFGNSIFGEFIRDDHLAILDNPLFESSAMPNLVKIFSSPHIPARQGHDSLYRPLTSLAFGLQFYISKSPVGFHILNIILHAICSWLIFLLAKKYLDNSSALIAMILFIALPIHVEAVSSIIGRAELLALLFSLLAIYSFLSNKNILGSIFLFLGLLSKETAVIIAAVIPLFLILSRQKYKEVFLKSLWFIPPIIIYFILRFYALGQYTLGSSYTDPIVNPLINAPPFLSLITSLKILWLYIAKTIVPITLSPDYSMNQIPVSMDLLSIIQAFTGLAILIGTAVIIFRTSSPLVRLGLLLFILPYFLISNIFIKIGTIMGERLFYIPSAGLILAAAVPIQNLLQKIRYKFIIYTVLAIILSAYGWVIIEYNKAWLTQDRLFEYGYKTSPESYLMRTAYAQQKFNAGFEEEAIDIMDEIIADTPESALFFNIAGEFRAKKGNFAEAEKFWLRAIEVKPDDSQSRLYLGAIYYLRNDFKSTESVLTPAIETFPSWENLMYLGLAKIQLGKPEEAIQLIERHHGPDPKNQYLILVLASANNSLGREETAKKYFERITDPAVLELIK